MEYINIVNITFLVSVLTLIGVIVLLRRQNKELYRKLKDLYSIIQELKTAENIISQAEEIKLTKKWYDYLKNIDLNDQEASFLTEEELPSPNSSSQKILKAFEKATQRALPSYQLIKVEKCTPGKIKGSVRILLPQGNEREIKFNDWQDGWRAECVFKHGNSKLSFPMYYSASCMNPIRAQNISGIDTSDIEFIPHGSQAAQKGIKTEEFSRVIESQIKILRSNFEWASNAVERNGTRVHIEGNGLKVVIRRKGGRRIVLCDEAGQKFKFEED
ncbi:hypothetical protein ACE1B6_16915 [Aerosakkonemataceae cyanobacterium BLCC-F154]|uniref:Uncharacterized protein n=1 Tax=Floridaenema fluviatile BLCC-F154 TaxID=3153640 RepID=A0ABV4YDM2_9CYAN